MITVIYLPLPLLTKEGKGKDPPYKRRNTRITHLKTRRPDFFFPQVEGARLDTSFRLSMYAPCDRHTLPDEPPLLHHKIVVVIASPSRIERVQYVSSQSIDVFCALMLSIETEDVRHIKGPTKTLNQEIANERILYQGL